MKSPRHAAEACGRLLASQSSADSRSARSLCIAEDLNGAGVIPD